MSIDSLSGPQITPIAGPAAATQEQPVSHAQGQSRWTKEKWFKAGRMASTALDVAVLAACTISLIGACLGIIPFATATAICWWCCVLVTGTSAVSLLASIASKVSEVFSDRRRQAAVVEVA